MKYSKRDRDKLIDGIIPMLRDVQVKIKDLKESKKGHEILALGVTKTRTGEPIVRGKTYTTNTPVMAPVNHRSKLEKIIKEAKTEAQVENDIALYLAKNGKSLEAIKGEA